MDWIEVTARSVDEAKELALDRLGVVEEELEFEVLDEREDEPAPASASDVAFSEGSAFSALSGFGARAGLSSPPWPPPWPRERLRFPP